MLCYVRRARTLREMTITQEFIQIVLYLNIIFIYSGLHIRRVSDLLQWQWRDCTVSLHSFSDLTNSTLLITAEHLCCAAAAPLRFVACRFPRPPLLAVVFCRRASSLAHLSPSAVPSECLVFGFDFLSVNQCFERAREWDRTVRSSCPTQVWFCHTFSRSLQD